MSENLRKNDLATQTWLSSIDIATGLKYLHSVGIYPTSRSKVIALLFSRFIELLESQNLVTGFYTTTSAREFLASNLSGGLNSYGRGNKNLAHNLNLDALITESTPKQDEISDLIAQEMNKLKKGES